MSQRRCFVHNCPSRDADNKKNISMFTVPTDDGAFALWQSAIPQGPRELSKFNHICEYHFEKGCINWTKQIKLTNGSIIERLLQKPRLRRGSIPTKFGPNLCVEKGKKSTEDEDEPSVSSDTTSPSAQPKSNFCYTGYVCSVSTCMYAKRKNVVTDIPVSFHKYPMDPILQGVWVNRCRLSESKAQSIEQRRVCSLHFEDRFLKVGTNNIKRLAKNCAPTLNLPGDEVPVECAGMDDEPDEPDPLAQPTTEMIEDVPSSPMIDHTTAEELSDEDILVIDEPPESSDMAEMAIEPPPGPPPPPDPLVPIDTAPKRGRPFGSAKSKNLTVPSDQNFSAQMDSLLNASSEERSSNGSDKLSKLFENIEFDPYSLEKFDLRDPLETACADAVWKRLNHRARKATLRANFKRIACLLPDEYKRGDTSEILTSALEYLQWVGKRNSSLALMNEMLMQKHYALRTKHERLARILLKSNASRN